MFCSEDCKKKIYRQALYNKEDIVRSDIKFQVFELLDIHTELKGRSLITFRGRK